MSQINFGERYFKNRERIAKIVAGIRTLAEDSATDLSPAGGNSQEAQDLFTPFLFLICGETNSGKSTLINGLFGEALCHASPLPDTRHITYYRHDNSPPIVRNAPQFEDQNLAFDFLENFHLVDTPGTDFFGEQDHHAIDQVFPAADLILFVFSVGNPWSAATWNQISELPREHLSKVAFIVQQSDKKAAADLKIILGHMADLSMKRLGLVPEMFAVSGKKALEAKQSDSYSKEDDTASGFRHLDQFIDRQICNSIHRTELLQKWQDYAADSLSQIEGQIESKTGIQIDQSQFLESLESEIDSMRERLVTRLPRHLTQVAAVFETEAVYVTKGLYRILGPLRSLWRVFIGDRTGHLTEAMFVERLRVAVETVAESDGKDVVSACEDHWADLDLRVHEAIGTRLGDSEPVSLKLEAARQRFVERIGRAAHQAIGNLHVRKELERELRRRSLALKSFTATALILLIAAAVCGIFSIPFLPDIFLALFLVFFGSYIVIALITRSRISRQFQNSLLDTCGLFADTLRTDYEEGLRLFFQDYTSCLNSIRKHLAGEKLAIEPQLARWQNLFLTLKSIEQDL